MSYLKAHTVSKASRKLSVGGLQLDITRRILSLIWHHGFALEFTAKRILRLKRKRLHLIICLKLIGPGRLFDLPGLIRCSLRCHKH